MPTDLKKMVALSTLRQLGVMCILIPVLGDQISTYVQKLHHSHGIDDTSKLEMNNLVEQRQILRK